MSALRLGLSPSPLLAALIVAVHAAAALSVWTVIPAPAGAFVGAGLLALGCLAAWSRALLRSRSSVRALELGRPGLTLELASGDRLEASVSDRRYVSNLLVALPTGSRTVLVTRDMLSPDLFRALRIWALWQRLPRAAAGAGVAAEQLNP